MNCLCFDSTKRLFDHSSCHMSVKLKYGSPTQLTCTMVPIFRYGRCKCALFFNLTTCTISSMVHCRNLLLQISPSRSCGRRKINMPLLQFLALLIRFINKKSSIAPHLILCGHNFRQAYHARSTLRRVHHWSASEVL